MSYNKDIANYFQPTVGGTVVIPQFDDKVLGVCIDPVTALVGTVNIVLPAAMNGQVIRVFFTNGISVINLTAPSSTGGIIAALTSASLGTSAAYGYFSAIGKWVKA